MCQTRIVQDCESTCVPEVANFHEKLENIKTFIVRLPYSVLFFALHFIFWAVLQEWKSIFNRLRYGVQIKMTKLHPVVLTQKNVIRQRITHYFYSRPYVKQYNYTCVTKHEMFRFLSFGINLSIWTYCTLPNGVGISYCIKNFGKKRTYYIFLRIEKTRLVQLVNTAYIFFSK